MLGFARRYRVLVNALLYLIGFLAPWQWLSHSSEVTLWLTGSTLLARAGWLGLASATRVVTLSALSCLSLGALLSLWSAASAARADGKGRRAVYIGMWFQALGASVLMPVSGALVFLIISSLFSAFLLWETQRSPASGTTDASFQPRWLQAFVNELFPVSFALCFAVFAWRYNAHVLIQCLLVCFGISLVAQAALPRKIVEPK